VLYLPKFDAGRWLDIVEHERPVIAFVVPAMARLLIHHPGFESADLSSLKRLILGVPPCHRTHWSGCRPACPEPPCSTATG